jgi:hypothetical protein
MGKIQQARLPDRCRGAYKFNQSGMITMATLESQSLVGAKSATRQTRYKFESCVDGGKDVLGSFTVINS